MKEGMDLFCTQLKTAEAVVITDKCHVYMFII
jgi:hypothetical protein